MVAPATSHQPSLISSQLLTERSQVLAFPVFFKTEFHPRFVQRALISRSWLRHMMVYTEETEVKEACETTSITIASLKLESGEEEAGLSLPQEPFEMDPSGKFGQHIWLRWWFSRDARRLCFSQLTQISPSSLKIDM